MYVPRHFSAEDLVELGAYMRTFKFAALITTVDATPYASHLPLVYDPAEGAFGTLYGHVARANSHWQSFAGASDSLAIFTGPNAYVSPNWLAGGNAVPTWNYVAVHAYGRPQIVENEDQVLAILARLTGENETPKTGMWTADKMDQTVLRGMLKGIVAFAMPVSRIEGKRKMSQNKPPEVQQSAVAGLRQMQEPASTAVADIMDVIQRENPA
ncbi:MAG: FMN-binding negative transcriptional regulator [Rhodospirillales bacterium]|nr:FMN-binding negative transcriptional regulator [Rhodospirillales bacterium]